MKRLISLPLIAILILSVIPMSSCAKKPGETNAEKITVALDWTPNTNHTGLYVALQRGYFEELGLDVTIIEPASDTAVALCANGQADFAVSFQEEVTAARCADNPFPVVAVAAILQHNTSGFAALSSQNIRSPKDFEYKRYGSWGTELEKGVLTYLMKKYGANFNTVTYLNDNSTDFLAGVRHNYDFSWIFYGWDGIAAEISGAAIDFMLLQDLDPALDYYTPLLIAGETLIKNKPETIKKFLAAASRGYSDCAREPDACAEILLKYAPEIDRELAVKSLRYLADNFIADAQGWGYMKESVWQNFADFMYNNGVIDRELDIMAAYTNDFLPK